jgi:hypothetical protein
MIRLLFVGDGERDAATNPHLVSTLTGSSVDPTTIAWPRLNRAGRGYDRKLLFAIRQARDDGLGGVVATIDRDRSPGRDRLRELEAARAKDRETATPLPAALGAADPHAEAWLLDDPVAVRTVLRLPRDAQIPNVRRIANPKAELTRLHARSPRADETARTILAEIAQALDPRRLSHERDTGFAHFADDVRHEIGPLARPHRA